LPLLAGAGYRVRGLDVSERMVTAAATKAAAAGVVAAFRAGDASRPPYEPGSADAVLARHVL
jgi:ubiquinone/menaquinone biosynthesis C-methylase UbiE